MRKVIMTLLTGILILLCVTVEGQAQCDWIPGDYNCNGTPFELTDVVTVISYYRGLAEPCYFCDCGIYGEHFPVPADPNGNCIPFEFDDVFYALRSQPPRICPDCLRADDRTEEAVPDSSENQK